MTVPHDEGMTPTRDDPVTTPPQRPGLPGFGIGMMLSGIMILLGVFVLGRLLARGGQPLTGTVALDLAFGLFFVARGSLAVWAARRRARSRLP